MLYKKILMITVFTIFIVFMGCKDNVNSPENSTTQSEMSEFEVFDSELSMLKSSGVDVDPSKGIFSIGWHQFFRPDGNQEELKGEAMAVGFNEDIEGPPFAHQGINMGDVFINYLDSQIQLNKMINPQGGVMYRLMGPMHSDQSPLEFIPDETYEFEITGSDQFSGVNIELTSPEGLMDITSHSNQDVVNPAEDLTIIWNGGNEGETVVRIAAVNIPPHPPGPPNGHDGHMGGGMGDQHPPMPPHPPKPDEMIMIHLDNNPGEYTFTSEQLQEFLDGLDVSNLMIDVGQIDLTEVEHDDGTLRAIVRNGDKVMLELQ